jgi:hypothetical protein
VSEIRKDLEAKVEKFNFRVRRYRNYARLASVLPNLFSLVHDGNTFTFYIKNKFGGWFSAYTSKSWDPELNQEKSDAF